MGARVERTNRGARVEMTSRGSRQERTSREARQERTSRGARRAIVRGVAGQVNPQILDGLMSRAKLLPQGHNGVIGSGKRQITSANLFMKVINLHGHGQSQGYYIFQNMNMNNLLTRGCVVDVPTWMPCTTA